MSHDYMKIIDGNHIANLVAERLKDHIDVLREEQNLVPGLTIIRVGEDEASKIYVTNKLRRAYELGIRATEIVLREDITEKSLLMKIEHFNNDLKTHGIIVQLPLPEHIDTHNIINAINPAKDVDGFHPANLGKLFIGIPGLVPCTALGCLKLIQGCEKNLAGKSALVVGRSNIVGKPIAAMLLQQSCTVTVAHSKTVNLAELVAQADIVVAAVGVPGIIKGEWIKPGSIVIDVGITRINAGDGPNIAGDVEFKAALQRAKYITPVPGGVGPMTVVCLMANTIKAACEQRLIEFEQEIF